MKPDEGGRESTPQEVTSHRIPPLAVIVTATLTAISPKPAAAQHPDKQRTTALKARAREWTNSIGMKFVRIGPGRFAMGTPEHEPNRMGNEKRHEVRITRAYLLGVHEVTRGQFRAFLKDTGYRTDAEKGGFALIFTGSEQQRHSGGSWRDVGFEQTDDHRW